MYIYIYIFLVFFEIGTKRTKQERQTLLKYFDLNLKKMIMKVSQSIFLEEQMSEVKYCFFLMASMINDNESTEEKSTFFQTFFSWPKRVDILCLPELTKMLIIQFSLKYKKFHEKSMTNDFSNMEVA